MNLEQQIRALQERGPVPFHRFGPHSRFVQPQPVFLAICGVRRGSLEDFVKRGGDIETIARRFRKVLAEMQFQMYPSWTQFTAEVVRYRKDGRKGWMLESMATIYKEIEEGT